MWNSKLIWLRAVVTLAIVSLTGYMVGPKYHTPVAPVPTQFKEGGTPDSNTPDIAYSDWWRVFQDAELTRLETEADAANQDIKLAMARVEQADAGARYARSFLFPTISLGASASRTREAQNRPNVANSGGTTGGSTGARAATYNDFQLPAFLSYEVDAWGRVRHSLEAANATEQATAADLRFVRHAVEANVAMDYYSLREIDAERQVLDATVQEMQWMYNARNWSTRSPYSKGRPRPTSRFRAVHLMVCRRQFPQGSRPNCWRAGLILPR